MEAPIRFARAPADPDSKRAPPPAHAEFDLAPLGIDRIGGIDATGAPPVRLPPGAEPGMVYMLDVGFSGAVIVIDDDEHWPSLLDTIRIIITDELTVQLFQAEA